jgi:hypothetical protein
LGRVLQEPTEFDFFSHRFDGERVGQVALEPVNE